MVNTATSYSKMCAKLVNMAINMAILKFRV